MLQSSKDGYMKLLINFFQLQNLTLIIPVAIIICVILWLIIRYLIKRNRFITAFTRFIEGEDIYLPAPARQSADNWLRGKNRLITKLLEGKKTETIKKILYETGLTGFWIDKLKSSPVKKYFRYILDYYIEEGFFICFNYALEKKNYLNYFKTWLNMYKNKLPLQKVAHSGNGEDFDGKKAYQLFREKEDEIREMLGDPNWKGRFFALKVFLNAENGKAEGLLEELFTDPNPIIRKTMAGYFTPDNIEDFKSRLFSMILNDPNAEVRSAALGRYRKTFTRLPELDLGALKPPEIIHIIQALKLQDRDDEAIATELMKDRNLEIRFHAANYLERSGAFDRFCTRLDLGDREDFNNKRTMLQNATSVGVSGFLKKCISHGSRESLLVAAEILEKSGNEALLGELMKKTIEAGFEDVHHQAVKSIVKRGDREAKELLRDELYRNIKNREILLNIIENITPLPDALFIDPLINILIERNDLVEITRDALLKKEPDTLIKRLIEIINNGRKTLSQDRGFSNRLLVQSMLMLAELKKDYCLSFIIENLTVLPVEFVSDLAVILKQFPQELLKNKIRYYLDQIDGEIRSHIIALLPNTGIKDFNSEIRDALNDADPLVRIASTFALVKMGDARSFNGALTLLRDPVEEVRNQVAAALGRTGKKEILKEMAAIFFDENEVLSIKQAIIKGISGSGSPQATGVLVEFLRKDENLTRDIISELKSHSDEQNIKVLIEKMKDGSESLKEKISVIFIEMGSDAWPALIRLLESELTALKTYASSTLDSSGGTEDLIKKLKQRNPAVRREAAKILSLIGTVKAFRGLIMASRDPDREVRINVVKALERLETDEGKEILKSLEEDPDAKIRKYTHWALERVRAKELV